MLDKLQPVKSVTAVEVVIKDFTNNTNTFDSRHSSQSDSTRNDSSVPVTNCSVESQLNPRDQEDRDSSEVDLSNLTPEQKKVVRKMLQEEDSFLQDLKYD